MKTLLPLMIVAGLVMGGVARADELADLRTENEALRKENAELRKQVEAFKGGIFEEDPEVSELKRKLEAAESAKQDLQSERTRLEQLAGMTAKGDLVESRVAMITTTYDDAADRTTVASVPELIQGPGGLSLIEHRMTLAFAFPGKTIAQPVDRFDLDLLTRDNSDDRYKNLKAITFVIDGESVDVPVATYDVLDTQSRQSGTRQNSPRKPDKTYSERLRLALDRATVNRISRATDVKLQLYKTTFTLTRENIATFVALRERHDLGK